MFQKAKQAEFKRLMTINIPFKNYVLEPFEQQLDANLELHVDENLTTEQRYVLTTKWVGEAWERVKTQKYLIKNAVYITISTGARMPLLTSSALKGIIIVHL